MLFLLLSRWGRPPWWWWWCPSPRRLPNYHNHRCRGPLQLLVLFLPLLFIVPGNANANPGTSPHSIATTAASD